MFPPLLQSRVRPLPMNRFFQRGGVWVLMQGVLLAAVILLAAFFRGGGFHPAAVIGGTVLLIISSVAVE